jgi:nicotinate-nucleotide pyrophosphorylase (carboxylating)
MTLSLAMKKIDIAGIVRTALKEDVGRGDITTNLIVPALHKSRAVITVKEDAVVCGVAFAAEVFRQLDPRLRVTCRHKDGDLLRRGDVVVALEGRTRAILTGERVALNFLSYLSAIATQTRRFCDAVEPHDVEILDTRKTTPGYRLMERHAVACGGGVNHRFNLNDMVLMKDNHRVISQQKERLSDTVRRLHQKTHKKVEIEVDHLWELHDVLESNPEMILLDNMSVDELKKAVAMTREFYPKGRRPLLEASGGISLETIRQIAATGVDRISVGSLTHTRRAVDMSLEVLDE